MWIVLAVVAVIAVAVIVVMVFLRPKGDDLGSVRSYHSALGTLEHLSDREGPPADTLGRSVRSRPPSRPGLPLRSDLRGFPPGGDAVPPVPVRGNDGFPDPERPLVFDDSRPQDRGRTQSTGEEPSRIRSDRAQRHALDSMNRRPKRLTSALIVGAVVLVIVVLALVGSKRSPHDHGHTATGSASTAEADHASSSSSSSDPSSDAHSTGAKSGTTSGTNSTKSNRTKTTPTTQPTEIVAVRSTSTSATYPVVTASYRVTVTATGPIWVAASSVSSGSTLWAGVLQPGAVQVIRATGTITVQLGTPSASLAVDKVPVIFPPTVHAPFVATFQPTAAAAAAAAAGSATTTVVTAPTSGPTSSP
jgi:hypothetical protein